MQQMTMEWALSAISESRIFVGVDHGTDSHSAVRVAGMSRDGRVTFTDRLGSVTMSVPNDSMNVVMDGWAEQAPVMEIPVMRPLLHHDISDIQLAEWAQNSAQFLKRSRARRRALSLVDREIASADKQSLLVVLDYMRSAGLHELADAIQEVRDAAEQ